jgi:Glyoxalase-like domain
VVRMIGPISQGLPKLYLRFKETEVSAELHVLAGVGHGFGFRTTDPETTAKSAKWVSRFRDWLDGKGRDGLGRTLAVMGWSTRALQLHSSTYPSDGKLVIPRCQVTGGQARQDSAPAGAAGRMAGDSSFGTRGHAHAVAGPNTFDTIGTLESWREKGFMPSEITAFNPESGLSRPLCAYPKYARYNGRRRARADRAGQPYVVVQRVDHSSRVHLDIESDDVDAEVARLEALSARRVEKIRSWWVMEAPHGPAFLRSPHCAGWP